jgi:hypothetical protein
VILLNGYKNLWMVEEERARTLHRQLKISCKRYYVLTVILLNGYKNLWMVEEERARTLHRLPLDMPHSWKSLLDSMLFPIYISKFIFV